MAPTSSAKSNGGRGGGGKAGKGGTSGVGSAQPQPSEPSLIDTTDCQCPICFESYDIGPTPVHSPAALRCGHVFGEKCVKQWITRALTANPPRKPTCPSCKKETTMSHVLPLFADFKMLDSKDVIRELREASSKYLSERDSGAKEIKRLSKENKQLSEEIKRLFQENAQLKKEAKEQKSRNGPFSHHDDSGNIDSVSPFTTAASMESKKVASVAQKRPRATKTTTNTASKHGAAKQGSKGQTTSSLSPSSFASSMALANAAAKAALVGCGSRAAGPAEKKKKVAVTAEVAIKDPACPSKPTMANNLNNGSKAVASTSTSTSIVTRAKSRQSFAEGAMRLQQQPGAEQGSNQAGIGV